MKKEKLYTYEYEVEYFNDIGSKINDIMTHMDLGISQIPCNKEI